MASVAPPAGLLSGGVRAINIGLAGFADPIRAAGAPVVALDWRPPAAGDRELGLLLAALEDDPSDPAGGTIAKANALASLSAPHNSASPAPRAKLLRRSFSWMMRISALPMKKRITRC